MRVIPVRLIPAILLWGSVLPSCPALAAATPTWYRFQAGAWDLSTGAGERRGQELLSRLAETYTVLREAAPELGPLPEAPPRTVRVVLFRSARDFAPFRRGEAHRGLYLSGPGQEWILLPDSGNETLRAARHELVHLMLRHGRRMAPPAWFEEGLADYYSTLEFSSGRLRLGQAPAAHAQLLRSQPWIDPARLMRMSPADDAAMGRTVGLFYAQSWAMVRWMMIEAGGAAKAAAFLALLDEGRSQEAAFRETYGAPFEDAATRARLLLDRVPADSAPDLRPAAAPPAIRAAREPLPEPEPDVIRAEALLDAGLEREAERLALETAQRYPASPAAQTLLGSIALRRGDHGLAREHLERAIALGSARARTHFEYAMLVRDTKGPAALVEQSLRQAVAADPGFAEAWLVLGNWLLTAGRAAEAAPCLERAAMLDPRRSPAWEAWGRALLEMGDRQRARQAASSALLVASTPEQREMARALLREIETRPAQPPKPAPPAQTPAGWQPREGDARAEGRLVSITCEDTRLLFRLEVKPRTAKTPAVTVLLETSKPNLVMLRGKTEGRREFVCGEQKPAPLVAAGYITAPPPPPPAGPEQAQTPPPAKSSSSKTARKAPARKAAPRPTPSKPKPEPVAGELVWLEFR
jgi:tetratricopeptide (TPR) repeat protein